MDSGAATGNLTPRWREPRRPRRAALLRLLYGAQTDKIAVVQWLRQNIGPIAILNIPLVPIVVVADANMALAILRDGDNFREKGIGLHEARYFLGRGLLTASTGTEWSRARAVFSDLFAARNIGRAISTAGEIADCEIRLLANASASDLPIDVYPAIERTALRTIGQLLFGPAFVAVADAVHADLRALSAWAERRAGLPIDFVTSISWRAGFNIRKARSRLYATLEHLSRRATGGEVGQDQLATFLLAGYETTAAACAWSLMLLAKDRQAYRDVCAEGESLCLSTKPAKNGGLDLPATRAIVKEAIRLFPPVWAITRKTRSSANIDGVTLARGSNVLINVFGIHRDPLTWDRADEFVPSRFGPARSDPEFYMPFGAGMRRCIGLHLGLAEASSLVAKFCVSLEPCNQSFESSSGLTLRPRGPVLMQRRR